MIKMMHKYIEKVSSMLQLSCYIILTFGGIALIVLHIKGTIDTFSFLGCMAAAGVFFCMLRDNGLEQRISKLEENNKKEGGKE